MATLPSETVTYDQLFSLTARSRANRLTDNIGNSQPTLDILHSAGNVEVVDGGESIEEKILYAYQDIEWRSEGQSVNTLDKEGVTTAIYPWRFALCPVRINKTDELRAQASAIKAMDFAQSKILMARQGLRTGINTALLGAQSGKSILGFQDTSRDSVSTGTLGGIDLSVSGNSFFRNQAYTSAVTFTTQTVTNMFDGWVQIGVQYEAASDMNEECTHIATGATLYGKALSTLESAGYTRFMGNSGGYQLNAGGQGTNDGPKYRNARIYKERATAASHIYGYNVAYLKLKILSTANFAKTPFVPTDATGVVGKLCFYMVACQLVTNNPRRSFVLTAVS